MTRPLDTSADAHERQLQAYRAMTPEQRVALADQMSTEVRSLAEAGVRARLGDLASEDEVRAELARVLVGPDLSASLRAHRVDPSR